MNSINISKVDLETGFDKLEVVESDNYRPSVIQNTGDLDEELTGRIQSGWNSWRKYSGVLCDRRMPIKLKTKDPASGCETCNVLFIQTWATNIRDENRVDATEMMMFRWQCGLTIKNQVKNKHVRGTLKIAPASTKVKESNRDGMDI
ncbi:uncharacterized protein [Palaemon carinicauda]|uniref:uncharacterized protein n=1 Tax=Palaemon carinicauda TaxID=392227 RepID=UPI0035B5E8DB